MNQLTFKIPDLNQLDTTFSNGAATVRLPGWATVWAEGYEQSDRAGLERALNEFSYRELSPEQREGYINDFESNIRIEQKTLLEQFLNDDSQQIRNLTEEDFKEFLINRLQMGYRTVTADLINGLRREGLNERIEEQLKSVKAELADERDERDKREQSQEKSEEIAAFERSLEENLEKVKATIAAADLADDRQFKDCTREVLSLFTRLNEGLDEIYKP